MLDQPDGTQVPVRLPRTDFDRDDLTAGQTLPLDASGGTYRNTNGFTFLDPDNHTGVSLHEVVSTGVGVAVDNVLWVEIQALGQSAPGRLSTASADLAAPVDADFPFEYNAQPAFIYDGDNLIFAVGARTVAPIDPPVMNGAYFQVNSYHLVLHLRSTLQYPTATATPATVAAGQPVQFQGQVQSLGASPSLSWMWQVGGATIGTGASPTYAFAEPGTYLVTATVTAPDGSSGTKSVSVEVTGGSTPPPASPPPTQPGTGTGGPNAPNVGPRQGSGPVVGGVPTDRAGTGAPGRSYAPSPTGSAGTATASAGTTRAAGSVVGYALTDATAEAPVVPPAARARDDSGRAARAGTEPISLPGWVIGVAVVVLLAAGGAWSERRRPTTTRPRRKR